MTLGSRLHPESCRYTLKVYSGHLNPTSRLVMVLLTVTAAAKAALDEYVRVHDGSGEETEVKAKLARYEQASVGSPIEHHDLIEVSKYLVARSSKTAELDASVLRASRLDTILRGAEVYRPPPPPKPEPVSTYSYLTMQCILMLFTDTTV